jgi:hypothetical protein
MADASERMENKEMRQNLEKVRLVIMANSSLSRMVNFKPQCKILPGALAANVGFYMALSTQNTGDSPALLWADVKPHALISDGMVLQQDSQVI